MVCYHFVLLSSVGTMVAIGKPNTWGEKWRHRSCITQTHTLNLWSGTEWITNHVTSYPTLVQVPVAFFKFIFLYSNGFTK